MEEKQKKRYISKNKSLFELVDKIKLWPARSGVLHGVKQVESRGSTLLITTHCGEQFEVWDSKNSRSARYLRNRWCKKDCPRCRIPAWKLEKYSQTVFSGSK